MDDGNPQLCANFGRHFSFHRWHCDHLIQEFKDKLTKPQAKWIERGSQSKCLEVSLVEHRLHTWYWYPKTNGAGSGGFNGIHGFCFLLHWYVFVNVSLQFQKIHSFRNSHTSICGLTFLNRNILYWDDQKLQSQTRICVHAHLFQILMFVHTILQYITIFPHFSFLPFNIFINSLRLEFYCANVLNNFCYLRKHVVLNLEMYKRAASTSCLSVSTCKTLIHAQMSIPRAPWKRNFQVAKPRGKTIEKHMQPDRQPEDRTNTAVQGLIYDGKPALAALSAGLCELRCEDPKLALSRRDFNRFRL